MKTFFLSVFVFQMIIMMVDEFYFHWKRNLPKWERWGHPVDTFFFLLPFSVMSFQPFTAGTSLLVIILSVLSCLMITKDEWVHQKYSPPMEAWLHSLLFIFHPAILISAYFLWKEQSFSFVFIFYAILGFNIYQLIFWNFYADKLLKKRL